jgi:IS1 family transposase
VDCRSKKTDNRQRSSLSVEVARHPMRLSDTTIVSFVWGQTRFKSSSEITEKFLALEVSYECICTDNWESFVIAFQSDNHTIGKLSAREK